MFVKLRTSKNLFLSGNHSIFKPFEVIRSSDWSAYSLESSSISSFFCWLVIGLAMLSCNMTTVSLRPISDGPPESGAMHQDSLAPHTAQNPNIPS